MAEILRGIAGVEIIACDERDPGDPQFFYTPGNVDSALFASEVERWAGWESGTVPASSVQHGLLRDHLYRGDFDYTIMYVKRRSKNSFEATWVWVW